MTLFSKQLLCLFFTKFEFMYCTEFVLTHFQNLVEQWDGLIYDSFEPCNQQFVDTYPVKLRYKEDPFNFKYCLRSEFWRSILNLCQNLFTYNDLWYRMFFNHFLNHCFWNRNHTWQLKNLVHVLLGHYSWMILQYFVLKK